LTDTTPPMSPIREAVGLFADRSGFEDAVQHLRQAGFAAIDLSVLDSHESLEAAAEPGQPWRDALTALVGEIKYEGPLVASGFILLAGGPTAALIASLIGAATAGIAAKEVLDEVSATPHTENFANALVAGGVILWVVCHDAQAEAKAEAVLKQFGAGNVHIYQRTSS